MKLDFLEPQTAALDFAPAILAIQQRPPSPMPRMVLWTLLILLGILLLWSLLGKLDIVASAEGKLVPQTYVKIVQPADAGIVREILVTEGDRVRAGQVLLRLDTTLSEADTAIVAKEVELRSLQLRRIEAEMSDQKMSRRPEDSAELFRQVDAQARARRQAYEDMLQTEEAVLEQAKEDLHGAQAQVVKLEKLLPIYREEEESLARLAQQGLVPKFQLAEKQRQRIETEQNLLSQQRTVASLQSHIAESQGRIARVTSEYRQQLFSERVESQTQLQKAQHELLKQEHRGRLSELRAPQDGIIKDVATYTVGAVVNAGTVLMSLVPIDEELVAEVMIRNDDVGFVREGQRVKVKLAAYPFQDYGMIEGTVKKISADASETNNPQDPRRDSEDRDAPVSPYKALVTLDEQALGAGVSKLPLAPGMQVVADIRKGERTVMQYLLSPVQKTLAEAARER
ncbi:HlyD family type I secretion periplasmic adaptor subunit [Steroidobacter flavus]|uniref:Membrane fusion protein (MFP) family protein n=1 Tax=Steroidobacter flavus TaxID=1842136 RepID=A0ABV8T644_9GAMM